VHFIKEQLTLLYAAQKRYTPCYLLLAFRLFYLSRSAYKMLRDSCLMLPHISYLRQLSNCFTQTTTTLTGENAQSVYLKQKCSALADHERLCVLMIDEIYVSPKIAYKSGSLQGFATNMGQSTDTVEASTVQAFMLASIFSKNKDVAALQPVKNLDVFSPRQCYQSIKDDRECSDDSTHRATVSKQSREQNTVIIDMGNQQSSELTMRYMYNQTRVNRMMKVIQEILNGM